MAKYTTKKKDTLKSLAEKWGVTRKRLRELNPDVKFGKSKKKGGKGFKKLDPGQVLKLGKGVGVPQWKAELLEDPTYAAFDRQFDYNRSKLQSDFIALKDRLKRDLERQEGVFQEQERQGLEGIDRSMENRGLYRSGQRGIERGELSNRIADSRQRFIDTQGETREEARRAKREGIADLKRRRAEERLQARTRLTQRDAETKFMV